MKRPLLLLLVLAGLSNLWGQTSVPPRGTPSADAKRTSPLADYAGEWTGTLNGRVWLTMHLGLQGEQLTGSMTHARDIEINDDGNLKAVSDEQTIESVVTAGLNPDGLLLTLKAQDARETIQILMRLVLPAKDTADLRMVGQDMPPGMPKPRPWHVVKTEGTAIPGAPSSQ